jgi:heptaprenylglyceryl phosphate synthase
MRYNDTIAYNESSVSYVGTVEIRVPGLSNPIVVNNLTINFTNTVDYSNQTTIGFITINSVATGYIVIEADFQQAQAISNTEVINISSACEVSIQY